MIRPRDATGGSCVRRARICRSAALALWVLFAAGCAVSGSPARPEPAYDDTLPDSAVLCLLRFRSDADREAFFAGSAFGRIRDHEPKKGIVRGRPTVVRRDAIDAKGALNGRETAEPWDASILVVLDFPDALSAFRKLFAEVEGQASFKDHVAEHRLIVVGDLKARDE